MALLTKRKETVSITTMLSVMVAGFQSLTHFNRVFRKTLGDELAEFFRTSETNLKLNAHPMLDSSAYAIPSRKGFRLVALIPRTFKLSVPSAFLLRRAPSLAARRRSTMPVASAALASQSSTNRAIFSRGASLAFLAAFEVEHVVLVPAMFVVSAQGAIRSQTAR